MKTRFLHILTAVVFSMSMMSCGNYVRQRVAVESVDGFGTSGLSGVQVAVTVRNDLRRDLMLDSCRAVFIIPSGERVTAELRGGAKVERRTTQGVRLRFKVTGNPQALYALWRYISAGRTDDVQADVDAVARLGGVRHRICVGQRSLSEIIRIFGVPQNRTATVSENVTI